MNLEDYLMGKEAEATGTHVMPLSVSPNIDKGVNPARTIRKVAEEPSALPQNEGQPGEQVKQLPQVATIHVDTTNKEAPVAVTKQAELYALPALRRYPLDNYAQVVKAAEYFDENSVRMAPSLRREYCSNLVKRASALGIEVGEEARHYGADGYGSDVSVEVALEMRRGVIKVAEYTKGLDYLKDNRSTMTPGDFASALGEFDKVAGLDELYGRDVPDPYWTTYGEKSAEDDGAILVGNDYISQEELKRFAKVHSCKLKDTFGDDFADEFRKDPVSITKSLPTDQKKMVIRLATSTLTDPTTT